MRRKGTRILLACVTIGALAGVAQVPALAAPATTTPVITIAAKSLIKPVTGDVFVVFRDGKFANAKIKGTVASATAGQVLQLFSRKFPFKNAFTKLGAPLTLTGASVPYSFSVTPTLATRYQVKLFTDSSETTVVAQSAVKIVFVTARGHLSRARTCDRPVCHQRFHLTITVPASTLRAERPRRFHLYFGLKLDRSGAQPGPPRRLQLGGGHARLVSVKKLNAQQYVATMTFSFRIGHAGYFFLVGACQKDIEPTDGLNLPGRHSCGNRFISSKIPYLG
ncbi:MAG: hypothetical protein LBV34_15350 [Nocardiopsaceae bacterium]|jgi:hypothetical protein|nr:hypothetical protein [Nocardiopsaceae bacterium]